MTTLSSAVNPRSANPWIPAFAYGLSTLVFLWGTGGGSWDVALPRLGGMGALALALAYGFFALLRQPERLRGRPGSFALGLGVGLAAFLPVLVLSYLIRHTGFAWQPDLPRPNVTQALVAALFAAPAIEIIGRGLLQPAWGLGSVAFLDALTFGFGTQNFAVFLATWALSYTTGHLERRFGLFAAIVARVTWTLLVLLTLGLI